ncbi:MAG: membrane dipeptidase [Cytophagaceae bacterium]|nr:membrane dipeptidase [Gemmatimonadaceae bacterium]
MRRLARLVRPLILLPVFLAPLVVEAQTRDSFLPRARRLMREAPFIDTHNDLPWMSYQRSAYDLERYDPDKGLPDLDTDLPRAVKGGVGGQFWAAYVPSAYEGKGAGTMALEQIDMIHRMIARSPRLAYATTADDIVRIHRQRKIASLIGIEGGHAIDNSLGMLRQVYALGVRYLTLSHGSTTAWADASTDAPRHGGLNAFGEDVVREMNRLGMMVDISHVSDGVMSDVARISEAPLFFSHSSVRALADHPRNVPDSILRLVKQKDGVVMANAYPAFVDSTGARLMRDVFEVERRLRVQFSNDPQKADSAFGAYINNVPGTTLERYVDHIEYIITFIGIDHVGIGADLGSLEQHPKGLDDISMFPNLVAELLRRGYTDAQVKQVMGGNLLRVMRKTEAVARRLRDRKPLTTRLEAAKVVP